MLPHALRKGLLGGRKCNVKPLGLTVCVKFAAPDHLFLDWSFWDLKYFKFDKSQIQWNSALRPPHQYSYLVIPASLSWPEQKFSQSFLCLINPFYTATLLT